MKGIREWNYPAEAMSELSESKPDLMVTDMTMPGRSGLVVTRWSGEG